MSLGRELWVPAFRPERSAVPLASRIASAVAYAHAQGLGVVGVRLALAPGDKVPAPCAVRKFLKFALRSCALRCIDVKVRTDTGAWESSDVRAE